MTSCGRPLWMTPKISTIRQRRCEKNTSFKKSQENCKEITNAINAWDLYIRSLDGASYIVIRNGSIAFV